MTDNYWMQVYKYNQMSCDLDLFSWASREVTCILKHHNDVLLSVVKVPLLGVMKVYQPWWRHQYMMDSHKDIWSFNFKLCACFKPHSSIESTIPGERLSAGKPCCFGWRQSNGRGVENRNFVSPSRCPRCHDFKLVNVGNLVWRYRRCVGFT